MFKLLRRFFNPIRWFSSAAILFVALVPGLIAINMASNASQLGWFRNQYDLVSPELWAFWAAATLSLSLLNLSLKHPLTQPMMVAGALLTLLLLLTLMAVGAAAWGGKIYWIDYFVALALALIIVRCCLGLKDSSRRITVVQAVGSGLLVLCLIFPWQFWILQNLSGSQRNTIATKVFGQAFVDAKQAVETCYELQQYAGRPMEVSITTNNQTPSSDRIYDDGTGQLIIEDRKIFEFNYLGQKNRDVILVFINQKRLYPSSYFQSTNSPAKTEGFTPETTFKIFISDPNVTSEPTPFNCLPP